MASSVDEKERMNIEKVFSFSQHLPQMVDLEKIKVRRDRRMMSQYLTSRYLLLFKRSRRAQMNGEVLSKKGQNRGFGYGSQGKENYHIQQGIMRYLLFLLLFELLPCIFV